MLFTRISLDGFQLQRSVPAFFCPCGRERAARTLSLLGDDELRAARDSGEVLEVRCEFCGEAYRVRGSEIDELLSEARSETRAEPDEPT